MKRAVLGVLFAAHVAAASPPMDVIAEAPPTHVVDAAAAEQLGYHAVAVERYAELDDAPVERLAALPAIEAIVELVDAPATRRPLRVVAPLEIDDAHTPAALRDGLRYHAGLAALDSRNPARGYALLGRVSASSRWGAAARLEIAKNELAQERASGARIVVPHTSAVATLFAVARGADPAAHEAVDELAAFAGYASAMASGDNQPPPENLALFVKLRGELAKLAETDAVAALAVSRLDLQVAVPRLVAVDHRTLEAIVVAIGCFDPATSDRRAHLAEVIADVRAQIGHLDPDPTAAIERVRVGIPRSSADATLRTLLDTREIREARAWRDELAHERATFEQAEPGWQTSPAGAEIQLSLTLAGAFADSELVMLEQDTLAAASAHLRTLGEAVDQAASTNVLIPIGPRDGLVVRPALCHDTREAVMATGPGPVDATHHGCGGCASGGDAGLVLGALAFRRRRAARSR